MRPTCLIRHTAASLAVATACLAVVSPTAGAVVNGEPSGPAPWAVRILTYHDIPGAPCTGVVVAEYWVATAAHCGAADPDPATFRLTFGAGPGSGSVGSLDPGSPESGSLDSGSLGSGPLGSSGSGSLDSGSSGTGSLGSGSLGSLDAGSLGSASPAAGPHVPVAAHRAPAGDVLLLKLAHPAPAPPVLRAGEDPAPGTELRFHGFGQTTPGGGPSEELRTGLTRLDEMVPRDGSLIGRNHSVRGGFGLGDSGGPLFHGDRLVGLHSGSDHAARRPDGTNPAWYESIPHQNAWIDRMIADH